MLGFTAGITAVCTLQPKSGPLIVIVNVRESVSDRGIPVKIRFKDAPLNPLDFLSINERVDAGPPDEKPEIGEKTIPIRIME